MGSGLNSNRQKLILQAIGKIYYCAFTDKKLPAQTRAQLKTIFYALWPTDPSKRITINVVSSSDVTVGGTEEFVIEKDKKTGYPIIRGGVINLSPGGFTACKGADGKQYGALANLLHILVHETDHVCVTRKLYNAGVLKIGTALGQGYFLQEGYEHRFLLEKHAFLLGNDLGKLLGWGPGETKSNANLYKTDYALEAVIRQRGANYSEKGFEKFSDFEHYLAAYVTNDGIAPLSMTQITSVSTTDPRVKSIIENMSKIDRGFGAGINLDFAKSSWIPAWRKH